MVDFRKIDAFFNGEKLFEEPGTRSMTRRAKILRAAKLLMPSLAAILVGLILVFPSLKQNPMVTDLDVTIPKKGELEKLHMEKTEFSITDKDNKVSLFTAERIDETQPGSKVLKIINPQGTIPSGQDKVVRVTSNIGYYNQNNAKIKIEQKVKAVYDDGTTALTEQALYDFNRAYGTGNKPVYAYGTWGELWAEGFEFDQKQNLLILNGRSKVINDNRTLWADKQIRYYRTENRLEGEKNVKVLTPTETLYADKIIAYLAPSAKLTIRKIDAYGNVKVLEGENTLYADKMIAFFMPGAKSTLQKIEAFGNVQVHTPNGIAKGDYGLYRPEKLDIELRENVTITQNGNVIHGDKAQTNLKTSVSRIIAEKKKGQRVSGIIKGSTVKNSKRRKKSKN